MFIRSLGSRCAVPFHAHLNTSSSCVVRFYCDRESEEKQLGGFVYKEEPYGFRSLWRKPFTEREEFWKPKLDLFANRTFPADLTRLNPENYKYMSFSRWLHGHKMRKLIFSQQYIEDRMMILGCNLAAAHFVVYRGGAIKFIHTDWIKDDQNNKEYDEDLPNEYHPDYVVEGIDLSGTPIVYEGLRNLERLDELKWLSFAHCPFFDNWCLDRVSGENFENLEYLDVSFTNVTGSGLNALYRFRHLKRLKVSEQLSEDPEAVAYCLELKKCMPELNIEGISFTLLDGQHEHKALPSA